MRKVARALLVMCFIVATPAVAAEEAAAAGVAGTGVVNGLIALAAGIGLGMAALGTALGQGRATAAAMESIGRNPNSADRILTPLIIGLALMEALSLYMFVIAILLTFKF